VPRTRLVVFCELTGRVPLLELLDRLPKKTRRKCMVRIERLRELGHEIRRPEAAYLRDGVFELRVAHRGVNLRILYFFHDTTLIVLSHGFAKQEAVVPDAEIERAMLRRRRFAAEPSTHTWQEFP
jgi:phage-related protein